MNSVSEAATLQTVEWIMAGTKLAAQIEESRQARREEEWADVRAAIEAALGPVAASCIELPYARGRGRT